MNFSDRLAPERVEAFKRLVATEEGMLSFSPAFSTVVKTLENELSSIRQIEDNIQSDPSIARKILRIINSPFYGCSEVNSIGRAIVILGFNQFKEVVFGASLLSLADEGFRVQNLDAKSFDLHSVGTAFMFKFLARTLKLPEERKAFSLGVAHDVGKLTYLTADPLLIEDLMTFSDVMEVPFFKAEEIVNLSHGKMGAALLKRRHLPEECCVTTEMHHQPSAAAPFALETALVHVADYLAVRLELGYSGSANPPPPLPEALGLLGLDAAVVDDFALKMSKKRDDILELSERILS